MNEPEQDFAQRVREARQKAGYETQAELAEAVGVKPQSVQQWESDNPKYRTQPRGKRLKRLAEVLGVGERWLKTGEGPPEEGAPKGEIGEPLGQCDPQDPIRQVRARRQEADWWENVVKQTVTEFDDHLGFNFYREIGSVGPKGRIKYRPDYASGNLVAQIQLIDPRSTVIHRLMRPMWPLAVLSTLDKEMGVERSYCLFLFHYEAPEDTSREEKSLNQIRAEASVFGIEIKVMDDPSEIANEIIEAEGYYPEG